MKRKNIICMISIMLLIISVAVINIPVSYSIAMVSVEPPSIIDTTLIAGETFSVDIVVTAVNDLYGYDVKLGYDTSVLTATAIVMGDFFPPGSTTWKNQIDDTAGADPPEKGGDPSRGYAWLSVTLPFGTIEGVDGSGTLATVTFTVDALGETVLHLYGGDAASAEPYTVFLADPFAEEIPRTVVDGYFANIEVVQYTLTISVVGSGTTVPAPGPHLYDAGTAVSVDAQPASGWMLDHWLLDDGDVGAADPYVVTMNDDHTLAAVFVETGTVSGTVTDSSTGTPIAGATVTADGNPAITDTNGEYSIPDLIPGDYTVEASAAGYHVVSKSATVAAGETTIIDFQLEPLPEVTIDTLIAQVEDFYEQGEIDEAGIRDSLIDKLTAAKAQIEKGKTATAKNILGALINHLEAQSGKHISTMAAGILIQNAQFLIDNL